MRKNILALLVILPSFICSNNLLSHVPIETKMEIAKQKELCLFKESIENLLSSNEKLDHVKEGSPLLDQRIFDLPDLLQALLEKGIDVDVKGHHNQTPLHAAIHRRKLKCVSILLKAGADPNYVPNHWISNKSPLEEAIIDGQIEIVKELLRYGANAKVISKNGNNLIMRAFSGGVNPLGLEENRNEIIKALIEFGADPLQVNNEGHTPLRYAINRLIYLHSHSLSSEKRINSYKESIKYFRELISDQISDTESKIESCAICLEEFPLKHLVKPCGTCKMEYCASCIRHWSQKSPTCPVCKKAINVQQIVPADPLEEIDNWLFQEQVD